MVKYYAVKVGKKTGIYETWTEAETQVRGVSNAKYKSFKTKEEAEVYLADFDKNKINKNFIFDNKQEEVFSAYVDGSFNKQKMQYGSGIVIIKEDTIVEKLIIPGNNVDYLNSYQIAGEVLGCIEALKWAYNNNVRKIVINYDYQGIESWALGDWKAKKLISIDYVKEFNILSKDIEVIFNKVKGHSGDLFNDLADELAREAASKDIPSRMINEINQYNSDENFLLHKVKSTKNRVDLNVYLNDKIYDSTFLYAFLKKIWKNNGYLVKDISSVKTLFFCEEEYFLFQIIDHNGEKFIYEVGVDELDASK